MAYPKPETILESVKKSTEFAAEVLYPMFSEYSENYEDAITSVCASLGTAVQSIMTGKVKLGIKVAEKKADDDDVSGKKGGPKKLKAGDKDGEAAIALELGHTILERLEEVTDSEACVKEILIGLICSLAATFDMEEDVIRLLIMTSIGGDD